MTAARLARLLWIPLLLSAAQAAAQPSGAPSLPDPFLEHANDPTFVPCIHRGPQHPAGHHRRLECLHRVLEHPEGHRVGPLVRPCEHWKTEHPDGHQGPLEPCLHVVAQHPGGDPGPRVPCRHRRGRVAADLDLGLDFYTSDGTLQEAARQAARRLRERGVEIGRPRALSLFRNQRFTGPDGKDVWATHYNPVLHAIQISQDSTNPVESLQHEMGHATLGHRCVKILGGGPHAMDKEVPPGLALSEGWANFIALVVRNPDLRAVAGFYKGQNWEMGHLDKKFPYSKNNEFRVGCILWDLHDANHDGPDDVSLAFRTMFQVYSPTLQTLAHGPAIPSLDDYLARLVKLEPRLAKNLKKLLDHNLTAPP